MSRIRTLVVAAIAVAALLPGSSAVAAPADDYRAVFRDWQRDQDVTSCRFTRAQLVNASNVAARLGDFDSYAPGFREEVRREISTHDRGGCRGVARDTSARSRSALRRLRIATVRPKGGLGESVTIRNSGAAGVGLGGATLRDRSGRRVKLGSGRLGGRRSLRVYTGCAKGRTKAHRRGSRLYACLRRGVWDDRGDVVKLVDRRRVVVAQRGYGRFRRVVRF